MQARSTAPNLHTRQQHPGSCSASANPGSTANTSRNCFCSYRVKSVQQGIEAQEVTASWKIKTNQLKQHLLCCNLALPHTAVTGAHLEISNSFRSDTFILCGHENTLKGGNLNQPKVTWSAELPKAPIPFPAPFSFLWSFTALAPAAVWGCQSSGPRDNSSKPKRLILSSQLRRPNPFSLWPNQRQDYYF